MINFDKIIDGVFVGTGPSNLLDQNRLKQAGFSAVLNLQTSHDFSTLGMDWNQLKQNYLQLGIAVYHFPIIDFDDNDMTSKLATAASTLNDIIDKGHTTYVHCTAGKQRSPSTVIGYLAWHTGLELGFAIDLVMRTRNCDPPIHVIETVDTLVKRFARHD